MISAPDYRTVCSWSLLIPLVVPQYSCLSEKPYFGNNVIESQLWKIYLLKNFKELNLLSAKFSHISWRIIFTKCLQRNCNLSLATCTNHWTLFNYLLKMSEFTTQGLCYFKSNRYKHLIVDMRISDYIVFRNSKQEVAFVQCLNGDAGHFTTYYFEKINGHPALQMFVQLKFQPSQMIRKPLK